MPHDSAIVNTDHQLEENSMTYIPDNDSFLAPSHANMEILSVRDVIVQELQQEIALFLLQANNVACDW